MFFLNNAWFAVYSRAGIIYNTQLVSLLYNFTGRQVTFIRISPNAYTVYSSYGSISELYMAESVI